MKNLVLLALISCLVACGGGGGGSNHQTSSTYASSISSDSSSFSSVPALKDLADFPIGMEVSAADQPRSIFIEKSQLPTINKHFNSLVAGVIMKMSFLHPEEFNYHYTDADDLADYAAENGMILHGHTLIWHWDSQIPDWMKNYTGDWQAMLDDHVTQITAHFAGKVVSWDVVNEAIDPETESGFRESIFYQKLGSKYIENAFIAAREADPAAVLYYNDFAMEASQRKLELMLAMLDDFKERGIPVDGVGFQMHTNIFDPSIEQIQASFKAVADRGYIVRISEMDVTVNRFNEQFFYNHIKELQKQRYKNIIKAYLAAVPAAQRGGITFWGLVDGESWVNELDPDYRDWPLLFNDDYSPKPAFFGVVEALLDE
jgi:endo-1,4-beta-xylanase